MSNWDEFLAKADDGEVFRMVGEKITFNGSLTLAQKTQMTQAVWKRYKYFKDNRQAKIFEPALDPNWWIVEEEKIPEPTPQLKQEKLI
jgi:hypothetical protein